MSRQARYLRRPWLAGTLWPWVTTGVRAGLAIVWLVAGAIKVGDAHGFGRAVHAYRILPYNAAMAVGATLPLLELVLGILLLLGAATRVVAGTSAALFAIFIAGIAWVWSHGYRVDCGCFGSGGGLDAGEQSTYLIDVVRDVTLLLLAAYLLAQPRGWLAVDNWLHDRAQIPSGRGIR